MGGVYISLLNPAKLGVRLVVGEGDVVVVGYVLLPKGVSGQFISLLCMRVCECV